MIPRQIGWSAKSNALYKVLKVLTKLTDMVCCGLVIPSSTVTTTTNVPNPPEMVEAVLYNWPAIIDERTLAPPVEYFVASEEDWADIALVIRAANMKQVAN